MSLWDLRMLIEQSLPWWAPFAFTASVIGVYFIIQFIIQQIREYL